MPSAYICCVPNPTESLTDSMILDLRDEANAAGDDVQAQECDDALEGDDAARQVCAASITSARAMVDDGLPFVPVSA